MAQAPEESQLSDMAPRERAAAALGAWRGDALGLVAHLQSELTEARQEVETLRAAEWRQRAEAAEERARALECELSACVARTREECARIVEEAEREADAWDMAPTANVLGTAKRRIRLHSRESVLDVAQSVRTGTGPA